MAQERAAFAGKLSDVGVGELAKIIEAGKKTGVVRVDGSLGEGTAWFREGSLVGARLGLRSGKEAFARLLSMREGSFDVEFRPVDPDEDDADPPREETGDASREDAGDAQLPAERLAHQGLDV